MSYIHPVTKEPVVFNSHEQLDKYVVELVQTYSEDGESFKDVHPGTVHASLNTGDAWKLLKGFDRAFWLMISFTDKDKWPAEHKPWEKRCPFANPSTRAPV